MIVPTCQVCGTTLDLEDGVSIETAIRRGSDNDDDDVAEFWEWKQELRFRSCGEEHMKSWMAGFVLPPYESANSANSSHWEDLGAVGVFLFLAMLVTGSVYGFVSMVASIF